jgi:hypothetical protein
VTDACDMQAREPVSEARSGQSAIGHVKQR